MLRDNLGFLTRESGIMRLLFLEGDRLDVHVVILNDVNVVPSVLWGPN
jgi:hypothetical protein